MKQLIVAESLSDIEPTFRDMYETGKPGFQVSPDVPLDKTLERLSAHVRKLGLARFTFNTTFTSDKVGNRDTGFHIDETEAERTAGIAVHHNESGFGRVALQLAKPGVTEASFGILSSWKDRRNAVSPRYAGELVPGMKTVFSEGIKTASGLLLGAAFHEFMSKGNEEQRQWTRYTYDGQGLR